MLMSIVSYAHQPDLSTLVFSQSSDGKYILQLNSALTAFEGEIDYLYTKTAYKTPEEFKKLVINHFEKNIVFVINDHDTLTFSNPLVILGHETELIVEVSGIPKTISSIYLKSTIFRDMPRNQSVVIMLKTGFPDQKYILNNENNQEIHLIKKGDKWNDLKQKQSILTTKNLLFIFPIIILVFYLFIRFNNKKLSNI